MMKNVLRCTAVALGWTTLATAGLIEPLVGRGKHLALYHWDGSAAALFGPVLTVFALVWLIVTALLCSAARPGRWRAAVWGGLLLLLPWLLANTVSRLVQPLGSTPWVLLGAGGVLLALLVLLWRNGFKRWFEPSVERTTGLLLLIAFSGMFFLVQIVWFWWSARHLNSAALRPHATERSGAGPHATARHGKIVWIVFDELSYRQLYEHRFPGLQLPAFDALAAQSAVWTHVVPAGSKTDLVLPALISGQRVDSIRATAAGNLMVDDGSGTGWKAFAQGNTVFQDALNAGYGTGVAGWYNPYCRLMPAVLDRCFWRMHTQMDNGLASDAGFWGNLRLAFASLPTQGRVDPEKLPLAGMFPPIAVANAGHTEDYVELLAEAERLLQDPAEDFVLLHMPVPHPGGIFNRRTGTFSFQGTDYLDNLALADRCLAALRATLETQGAWDDATVLVMGDHSWRINTMWRQETKRWTAEEEAATEGGHFDDRPGYMLKLPHETTGAQVETSFPALNTRALLDALMAGQIRTADELRVWVQGHASS